MDYPLFDAYFDYVRDTEPPLIFHRWSMLSALSAWLGRQCHVPFGDFRIFPNMYVMLIGDPGTRKSTAVKMARKVISTAGYTTFAGDSTSKEKFLVDLAGPPQGRTVDSLVMENLFGSGVTGDPKEVFVVADEFNQFMGTGNLGFIDLLGNLWDWDDEERPFTQKYKNSADLEIFQPTINILGGNTHSNFAACFPPQSIGQGFLSRMILVFSEASGKKITFPKKPPQEARDKLLQSLLDIRAAMQGEMSYTRGAENMLDGLYRTFNGLGDQRFLHYSTRRFTHLIKVCMLCAASRKSMEINEDDVLMGNSILAFAEHRMPQALGEFGKAKNADVADKIIAFLRTKTLDRPGKDAEIWKEVSTDLENVEAMQKMIAGLVMADKLQWVNNGKIQGYVLKKQMIQKRLHVDFNLLVEVPDNLKEIL